MDRENRRNGEQGPEAGGIGEKETHAEVMWLLFTGWLELARALARVAQERSRAAAHPWERC